MIKLRNIFIPLAFISYGCWGGYSIVDKTEKYDQEKFSIKKVVVIPCDFKMTITKEDKESKMKLEENGLKNLNNVIKKGLHDIKVEYTMVDDTSQADQLLGWIIPLKNELLISSILHEDPFDNQGYKTFTQKLFARSPAIDGKFARLSEVYGTPYALYAGIYSTATMHYQYFVIVNLVKGEIIYRNLKYYGFKAKNDNVEAIMYETIYSFKRK